MDKQSRKQLMNDYKNRRQSGGVFAIRNSENGKSLIQYTADLQGSVNRFEFSQMTGGSPSKLMDEDFNKYGTGVFTFEIIERLEQKEGQTEEEFQEELKTLYDIITESIDEKDLY